MDIGSQIAAVLLFIAVGFLFFMLGWGSAQIRRVKILRSSQEKDVAALIAEGVAYPWRRVLLASPAYLARGPKLLPYEGCGVLVFEPDAIRLRGTFFDGRTVDRRFVTPLRSLKKCAFATPLRKWMGTATPSYWISVGAGEDELCFAADTSPSVSQQGNVATEDLYLQTCSR